MKVLHSVGLAALLRTASSLAQTMPICSAWKGAEYEAAKQLYPALKDAIEVVQEQGSVPWYTDNMDAGARERIVSTLSTQCSQNTKIPLVVYGIPNKDCEAGYSNGGTNKNFDDYKRFIDKLATTFTKQNMIYIVEPDAVGLTANGGCGIEKEYPKYLKYALEVLTKNENAEIYLDIGHWLLLPTGKPAALAKVVNDIWPANGRVKGIAINTSNYQKTEDMIQLCESFASITGKSKLKCVIDTSRNYKGPSTKGEWCNVKNTGIGAPPTMDTGNSRAAYYLWVKPPGESDGECNGQTSGDAMVGPPAGKFFKDHFEMLWNNGYFVAKGLTNPTSKPGKGDDDSSTAPTPAPTTPEPTGPGTVEPGPTDLDTTSEAPSTTPSTTQQTEPSSAPEMPTPAPSKKKCRITRSRRV